MPAPQNRRAHERSLLGAAEDQGPAGSCGDSPGRSPRAADANVGRGGCAGRGRRDGCGPDRTPCRCRGGLRAPLIPHAHPRGACKNTCAAKQRSRASQQPCQVGREQAHRAPGGAPRDRHAVTAGAPRGTGRSPASSMTHRKRAGAPPTRRTQMPLSTGATSGRPAAGPATTSTGVRPLRLPAPPPPAPPSR
jgi:hypothetical protein